MCIRFAYISPPAHHIEPGYNGIEFEQVYNGWVRNVAIENSDNGSMLSRQSAWITVEDILFEGREGHHGISVFHANSNLLQNLDFNSTGAWTHSTTVDHTATGNVHSNIVSSSGHELLLDHHRYLPLENLFTEIGSIR